MANKIPSIQTYNPGALATNAQIPNIPRVSAYQSPQPTEPINAEYAMSLESTKIMVKPIEGNEVFAEQNRS